MDKKTLEFMTFCISKLSILLKLPQEEIYSRLENRVFYMNILYPHRCSAYIWRTLLNVGFDWIYERERSTQ